MKKFVFIFLLAVSCAYANDRMTDAQYLQYQNILKNTRCLVCQNQDLLDSNAPLAKDLKLKIYQLIKQNKSEDEIKTYLVERFGDFILFTPPFNNSTFFLWVLPYGFLLIGLIGAIVYVIRSKN